MKKISNVTLAPGTNMVPIGFTPADPDLLKAYATVPSMSGTAHTLEVKYVGNGDPGDGNGWCVFLSWVPYDPMDASKVVTVVVHDIV